MATRKSKVVKEEAEALVTKLQEIQETLKSAEKEEATKLQEIKNSINTICNEANVFCGAKLTKQDILNIIDLAIDSGNKELIQVPFELYYKD